MSWSSTIYVQVPDEATARAAAADLGLEFPDDGTIPTANHNFALHAPMVAPWQIAPTWGTDADGWVVLTAPGTPEPGYWAMLRLNTDWQGYPATMAALQAAGVVRALDDPPASFFD